MAHLGAVLAIVGVVGVLMAAVAALAGAWNEKRRRIRRSLRKVLQGDLQTHLVDLAHGRAIGFSHRRGAVAVTWDSGAWCLLYRIGELRGLELIVDDWVTGWAFAGEPHSAADPEAGAEARVLLGFLFEDAGHPEFQLELWSADAAQGSTAASADAAIALGNRWLLDVYEMLNRTPARAASVAEAGPALGELPSFRRMASEA
jgi:hypothetical protein